jgi:hypothetical protein
MQENLQPEELNANPAMEEQTAQIQKQPAVSDEDLSDVVYGHETEALSPAETENKEEEKEEEEEFFPDEMSLEALSEAFFQRYESGDIFKSNATYRKIRERFQTLFDELKAKAREAYLSEGGEADYFEFKASEEIEKFRRKLDETAQKFKELKLKKEKELAENVLKKKDIIHELTRLIENEIRGARASASI